ncbi:hypothetical protein [Aquimarina brevivitae]|uniref:RING-type E3 ubiquitin transferase n=1 Tax=Aquimarina brevivitae TaxID=323412 RepID=A0A4Q7PH10_9FLAO|nr:hypothetical protein [Aquimarina brevivitae]RZS99070.1 hypothetical protein EV197_0274 [Aquimarina brevivitae]
MLEYPILIFMLFALFVATIILLINYFSTKNRIRRKLKKIKPTAILSCKENQYVKIIGKAHNLKPALISPLSKKPCVYYQVEVERRRSSGDSNTWHTIIKDEQFIDFSIDSKGQKAIVAAKVPENAKKVYLTKDFKKSSGTFNDAPDYIENYLKTFEKSSQGFLGLNHDMRYREGIIEIGEEIAVLGIAKFRESEYNLDHYSSTDLFISGDPERKLFITDDQKTVQQL